MGLTREIHYLWIARYLEPRDPSAAEMLKLAVDAYFSAKESGELTARQLQSVVAAASSPKVQVYEDATSFLEYLSTSHVEAHASIETMARDAKWHVRRNSIFSLSKSMPAGDSILRAGLMDRSAIVREAAAEYIRRFRKKQLISELVRALEAEAHPSTRAHMEFCLPLLRDGYILEKSRYGGYSLTFQTETMWGAKPVDEEQLRTKGAEALAEEFRQESAEELKMLTRNTEKERKSSLEEFAQALRQSK